MVCAQWLVYSCGSPLTCLVSFQLVIFFICCCCCWSLWYLHWNLMKAKPFKLFSLLFLSSDLYDTHCGIWWRLTVVSDEDSLWNLMKTKPFKLSQLVILFYWPLWCVQWNRMCALVTLVTFKLWIEILQQTKWSRFTIRTHLSFFVICHLTYSLPQDEHDTHTYNILMNIYSYLCTENIEQQSKHVLVL